MRLLVAEDDPVIALLEQYLLEQHGFEPVVVANGEEALRQFAASYFPIVITDLNMPVMNGLELIPRLRAMAGDRYPYIIVVTAQPAREHVPRVLAAGADDFLCKPLDGLEFATRLSLARRIAELQQQLRPVKRLVPLCSYCHSLQVGPGQWVALDDFAGTDTAVHFSRGCCPACADQHHLVASRR
jgi:DNA-binding response OmpR family regulator